MDCNINFVVGSSIVCLFLVFLKMILYVFEVLSKLAVDLYEHLKQALLYLPLRVVRPSTGAAWLER